MNVGMGTKHQAEENIQSQSQRPHLSIDDLQPNLSRTTREIEPEKEKNPQPESLIIMPNAENEPQAGSSRFIPNARDRSALNHHLFTKQYSNPGGADIMVVGEKYRAPIRNLIEPYMKKHLAIT